MTNLEWIKKNINEMGAEAFIDYWFDHKINPWCTVCDNDDADATDCRRCAARWLEAKHQEPMPELKVGMFVKADNKFGADLGIVINNIYTDELAVAYKNGGYDPLNAVTIKAIYSTVSFRCCDEDTCMWRRD